MINIAYTVYLQTEVVLGG